MVVHVLLHTWKNKDNELRFKSKDDDEYVRLFLWPLLEVEVLGVEWDEEQMLFDPIKGGGNTGKDGKGLCGVM